MAGTNNGRTTLQRAVAAVQAVPGREMAWRVTDVWITLNVSSSRTIFGLYNSTGRVRLPPSSIAEEFFGNYNPRAPDPFDYGSATLPSACANPSTPSIPLLFLMTTRLHDFQMFDQLRHGVGTFELFSRAFPARNPVPILVLDTSHRALSAKRLAVLRPSQLKAGHARAPGSELRASFQPPAPSS